MKINNLFNNLYQDSISMHATCSIVSVFPWDICKMSNRMAKCIYHVLKIKRPFQCPNKKNLGCQRRGGFHKKSN